MRMLAYTDSVYTTFTDPSTGVDLYGRAARQHFRGVTANPVGQA